MIFVTEIGRAELLVTVSYTFTEGRPAMISGPMEDCYEAEADEADLISVSVFGFDILDILSAAARDELAEEALNHGASAAADFAEHKADYDRDQQIEEKHNG